MKIISLKRGDFVVLSLEKKVEKVKSGLIIGLGALEWAKLKLYNLEKKEYSKKTVPGPLEVASFTAIIAKSPEGKTTLHSHAVVTNASFEAFGGHLEEAEVSATFEAVIFESSEEISRYHDDKIGLNLIK